MKKNGTTAHCQNCPALAKSVFHGFSEKNLDLLANNKIGRSYERGDTFSVQGQAADVVYCIGSGNAKVTRASVRAQKQSIVRIAAAGDLLGYRCIFSEESFRATASALGTTFACKIDKNFIFQMMEDDPSFSRELLKRMGQEIANAENHHHSFCQKNVRERMAESLLLLKKKCGVQEGNTWRLDIQLTRSELSDWVGAAKETVIRCLSDFKEENLILQDDDCILILDADKLAEIAGL